jgi:hypothetical protein
MSHYCDILSAKGEDADGVRIPDAVDLRVRQAMAIGPSVGSKKKVTGPVSTTGTSAHL